MTRLRFGVVQTPLHSAKISPTVAMRQDIELMQLLDRLGFDEAWIGEHHSGGSEIIGSPEIFIAAAAEVTSRIKFGTGVTSISYHNPLWVADRFVQLDHMTRGRVMMGVGPGSLPSDSSMIGLSPTDTRELLSENIDIILRLLRGEVVTTTTKTHKLVDARLQLAPYSDPLFDIVSAGVVSPTGPRLAGMHGLGLFSIGATMTKDGFDALAYHFGIMEERAAQFGQTVSRDKWRLATLFHLAETKEQAYKDVEYGIEEWFAYWQDVVAFPQMALEGNNVREMIDTINDNGIGVIGTPDQAVLHIERLQKQSGGFGAMLMFGHDWANKAASFTSYDLMARHVMPAFQGHLAAAESSKAHTSAMRDAQTKQHLDAIEHMKEKYDAELTGKALPLP